MKRARFQLNPVTRRRLRRFRSMKRAYWSLILLSALFLVTLVAELWCNDKPLLVRCNGRFFVPVARTYTQNDFLGNGIHTRPDYKALAESAVFAEEDANWILFPPVPYGPYESIDPERIAVPDEVDVQFRPAVRAAALYVNRNRRIVRSQGGESILPVPSDDALHGRALTDVVRMPEALNDALEARFDNRDAPPFQVEVDATGEQGIDLRVKLSRYQRRDSAPRLVRLNLRGQLIDAIEPLTLRLERSLDIPESRRDFWRRLDPSSRRAILEAAEARFEEAVDPMEVLVDDAEAVVRFEREEVRFPFRPTRDHWLGTDSAGRDVFARAVYGLRISLLFGVLLVASATVLGVIAGAVQGYFGGRLDITVQRLIEIWSALPFLYIMILMGSVYGRSFMLLLIVYALFNWIGVSYYMRAEFLRLRKQDFVEAARCLGLSAPAIIFRHILPNALVPILTLFPFLLVGAVGALAALDYLGFGLPPPTPSLGQLLHQAQEFRWAWWLILYPTLALFVVMLLGVFIGEGVRNAYDPRQTSRVE